jgi:hypothetical protein
MPTFGPLGNGTWNDKYYSRVTQGGVKQFTEDHIYLAIDSDFYDSVCRFFGAAGSKLSPGEEEDVARKIKGLLPGDTMLENIVNDFVREKLDGWVINIGFDKQHNNLCPFLEFVSAQETYPPATKTKTQTVQSLLRELDRPAARPASEARAVGKPVKAVAK